MVNEYLDPNFFGPTGHFPLRAGNAWPETALSGQALAQKWPETTKSARRDPPREDGCAGRKRGYEEARS